MPSNLFPAPRLLVISGSSRQGSYNRRLAHVASAKARQLGAEVTVVDLRDLDLPLLDADLMQVDGLPAGAERLRQLFAQHDGLLLASPEYNAMPTPLLINAFDWLSLVPATEQLPAGTAVTAGMPVGVMAASTGALGGIRALPVVRTYLSANFAMVVVPEHLGVPLAQQHLTDEGMDALSDANLDGALSRLVASVVRQARWRQQSGI